MDLPLIGDAIYFALFLAPFVVVYWVVLELWTYTGEYYWQKWFLGHEYIVLEIRLPKEQRKTPVAMEMVLNGLWEPGDSNGWKEEWLNLNTLPIISFEIASIGGDIHFYFWVPDKFKPRIEAHIYAQYPQAEVIEIPDYTRMIPYNYDTHKIMGFEYKLDQPDPVPIKTYKMMKLDMSSTEEEEKIDPITQTIEVMASIGPHEHMWTQFVCRCHKKKYSQKLTFKERMKKIFKDKNPMLLFFNPQVDWQLKVNEEIDKLKKKYTPESKDKMLPMGGMLMPQESDFLKMMVENASKPAFEVGMRQIYFAPKEYFDGRQSSNMGSTYKAYSASTPYNNIKPGVIPAANDKWWEPGHAAAVEQVKKNLHPDYTSRKFFNAHSGIPYFFDKLYHPFVLSTEELATLYHFPGSVSQTPTFERISSTTVEAPVNLPT